MQCGHHRHSVEFALPSTPPTLKTGVTEEVAAHCDSSRLDTVKANSTLCLWCPHCMPGSLSNCLKGSCTSLPSLATSARLLALWESIIPQGLRPQLADSAPCGVVVADKLHLHRPGRPAKRPRHLHNL